MYIAQGLIDNMDLFFKARMRYIHNMHQNIRFPHFIKGDARARINNYEIYSIGGDVAVDFVGRYERLEEDLKHALGQVGLTLDQALPRAKTTFRKSAKPYRDYYDGDTREIVGDWYAREIKLLDYAF